MSYNPVGGNDSSQTDAGVDANAASTTTALVMDNASIAGFYIVAATGAHTTHVATLQTSPDGTNWFDTAHTITGVGELHSVTCVADQIRVKITTAQGAASTVDITVIIK
jgi:hypothetical protein